MGQAAPSPDPGLTHDPTCQLGPRGPLPVTRRAVLAVRELRGPCGVPQRRQVS